MTTANDIIKSAFRIAGVTVKGESPDSDEVQDALETLNDLINSLSNDSLFIYSRTTESFSLTGASSYTIGSGGDFDTVRPMNIVSAYVRQGTTDYPVDIITDEEYANISQKSINTRPYFLNYNPTYPLGTIKVYGLGSGYTLFLVTEKPLTTLTLNGVVSLPQGWLRYLKNQLSLEISAEYGQPPSEAAYAIAKDAMGLIKRSAAKNRTMDANPLAKATNNIYTGWGD